jgi:hypothetical protein
MSSETGNLKLDRHLTYESLGRDSKELVDAYAIAISSSLRFWILDVEAALSIMHRLNVSFNLKFDDGDSAMWCINELVEKWRAKTPDIKQQAEAIAFAIYKQRIVK